MRTAIAVCVVFGVIGLLAATAFSMTECTMKIQKPPVAFSAPAGVGEPFILSFSGDTAWVQVHSADETCPGDPYLGHGGEATGGPGPLETWCFEEGPGDSCGTNPPWDTNCFKHVDVRALPSQTNINYWHVDTYRTDQRPYCGSYALWCGSAALWEGQPVECGTWAQAPGYGNQWNCYTQLTLPPSFSVANGCTLFFDPRYDTECKYDYFYVDFWNGSQWTTLATFNATSNNPGAVCGSPSKPSPDYWSNTDTNRLANCNWQTRTNPDEPAFKAAIAPGSLIITSAPKFRWRFTSDGGWSDQSSGNTDGAAFIDNVWVGGDNERFVEDFETGSLNSTYWSLPNPDGVTDQWHVSHDPDPPYEGGDGGNRYTCVIDSSYVYRARPEKGFPSGASWRNQWQYRLMTPRVHIGDTGALVQYDDYRCFQDQSCDYTGLRVRFYDSEYGQWCPWFADYNWICGGCYNYWQMNNVEDVSYYGPTADSMQFGWEVMDAGVPGDICYGFHKGTEFLVDNVSIGFYDVNATYFSARGIDLLHDTFFTGICGYNSFFDAYSADTVAKYSGPGAPSLPRDDQLYLNVRDEDHLASVTMWASVDGGGSWVAKAMQLDVPEDPFDPTLGGHYYATTCPSDFGLTQWATGTAVWYYVAATDSLENVEYFPVRANPANPIHTGVEEDYLEFSILPMLPDTTSAPKILLVDGHNRKVYDWSPCLSTVTAQTMLENIYEQTLTDAGYVFDRFDIGGAGSNQQIQLLDYSDYDAVLWFTGPYFTNYLFDPEAQRAIREYLAGGGKVILCGDRIAYDMAEQGVGDDSLGGDFLAGIMGATYLGEMPSTFTYPYAYATGVGSVLVFGNQVPLDLGTIAVYRECPYLKDMSYVLTNASPPAGYTAQRLMSVSNPTVAQADEVIYTEYQNQGQCVFVNFDLSASVNHVRSYCDGDAASPAPDFTTGCYDGRVELMRTILDDIFGLPSSGGTSGVAEPKSPALSWGLAQNAPNPCVTSTEIRFGVAMQSRVAVKVFDVSGRLVRSLVNEVKEPGEYRVAWDGKDSHGQEVAGGVYFYSLDAQGYRATRKMLVLR